jgi:hypothetical protein
VLVKADSSNAKVLGEPSAEAPKVSIIIPIFNEEQSVGVLVEALWLRSSYDQRRQQWQDASSTLTSGRHADRTSGGGLEQPPQSPVG